jgi:hypothetical protein
VLAALQHLTYRQRLGELEKDIREVDNEIKAYLGDATIMEGDGLKVTWKKTKDKTKTDWEYVVKALVSNYDVPEDTLRRIVVGFTDTTPGHRQFLVKKKKEK